MTFPNGCILCRPVRAGFQFMLQPRVPENAARFLPPWDLLQRAFSALNIAA